MSKPLTSGGYSTAQAAHVRTACLHLAAHLHDFLDDLVVVGGLVPSLLVEQAALGDIDALHVGTLDLDLGLALAILDDRRYAQLTDRLEEAGFAPDTTNGRLARQRWQLAGPPKVTVDFLIPARGLAEPPGKLKHIEGNFAAFVASGLHLAFVDRVKVPLHGRTPRGAVATRSVWVAGPGAFVVLKALAFRNRLANKDAYDLHYVLQHHAEGLGDIARRIRDLRPDADVDLALTNLAEDFATLDSLGPTALAAFLGGSNDDLQADVSALVLDLCARCRPDVG